MASRERRFCGSQLSTENRLAPRIQSSKKHGKQLRGKPPPFDDDVYSVRLGLDRPAGFHLTCTRPPGRCTPAHLVEVREPPDGKMNDVVVPGPEMIDVVAPFVEQSGCARCHQEGRRGWLDAFVAHYRHDGLRVGVGGMQISATGVSNSALRSSIRLDDDARRIGIAARCNSPEGLVEFVADRMRT